MTRGFLPRSAPVFRPAASLLAVLVLALSAAAAAGPPPPAREAWLADLAAVTPTPPGEEPLDEDATLFEGRRGAGPSGVAGAPPRTAFPALAGGSSGAARLAPHPDLFLLHRLNR